MAITTGAAIATALLLTACAAVARGVNIMDYGALANDSSLAACDSNAVALVKAFAAANASSSDRVVLVPTGRTFTIRNVTISEVC